MPVIDLPLNRINKLLEKSVTLDELEEYCLQLGLDVEDKNDEKIKVEYNPNRPDFSSIAGITRALNGLLGLETGIPKYSLKKSGIKVLVEESIKGIRGHIQCAIIRDVQLTEDRIAELMNIQEALHWVIGRDRKKVSIGIHDMANITPPFRYFGAKATEHPFIPLTSEKKMTPKEICMEHPKGKKYVHLVDPDGLVPLLVDKNDGVLSFPPIINGVLTQVNQNTKDIFIDVTGPEEQAVRYCLEILA
ncbi:MAG: phenylalanine--tRNA ligase beta subunit-related protein, partial [Asgard group archaeon]|nr:phenylalanine--tRNA ligase beta subunit-related protein [Asgard group archaeon]